MTNKTQALGRRLIGALNNESVIAVVSTSTGTVTLIDAKTGKGFITVSQNSETYEYWATLRSGAEQPFTSFESLAHGIKGLPYYPKAIERRQRMTVKTHGAPKYVGISMGSFKPGNLSADF